MIIEEVAALNPDHRADLLKSGLTDETIARLGFRAVRPHDIKPHILPGVTSAYCLSYFDLEGQVNDFERWRLFPPIQTRDGHTHKYYQAKGTEPHVY